MKLRAVCWTIRRRWKIATTPANEEPGFKTNVNEPPEDQNNVSEDTLEDDPLLGNGSDSADIEEMREEAGEERK